MASDLEIMQDFDTCYLEAYNAWSPFYPKADIDLRFYMGDQWHDEEKRQLFQEGRNQFVFNRARRNINIVDGYQRKHRLSSVAVPVENSSQETADQFSQLLLNVMDQGGGYGCISDSFSGALKTGMNLISVWVDYRDDLVNGDIKFSREPYNGFILDPYITRADLSDCTFLMRRKFISADHACSLLPEFSKEIRKISLLREERDNKFTWLPYQRNPAGEKLCAYSEFFRQKWRNVPVLVDMETGQTTEFDVEKGIVSAFLAQYPQLKVVSRPKMYIEQHIIINKVVITSEINPYGLDEYPFVPTFAFFEPESDDWSLKVQSLMRCMIDPQREANRRRSQMSDMLDSQINSGYIADEDSVVNPRSLFQTSQGRVIWRRRDAKPGAIEKIMPAQIPPSMFQLQELFDRDMMEIAGVNDAMFGQTENPQESGVLMMLRQGASIVNLQGIFDRLRDSQKSLSKKVLKLIQKWTPEKIERIINQRPSEEFYNKDFMKYDIAVQEGVLTDTQKQMFFRQLVDLRQLGAPVTGAQLAKAAPIQGGKEYVDQIQAMEEKQQQQAAEAQQMQMQLASSEGQSLQAAAINSIASSKERFTRAVANMGLEDERASEAVERRATAALERVRAIKELAAMDDDKILKYIKVISMMEGMSRSEEMQTKADDVAISEHGNEPAQQPPETGQLLGEIPQNANMENSNG